MKILYTVHVFWLGTTQGWSFGFMWVNIFSIMYSQQIFPDQTVMESCCLSKIRKTILHIPSSGHY